MGTIIRMITVSRRFFRYVSGGSIRLSCNTAVRCMRAGKMDPGELGLIIYTGVYRHKNIGEPAIASIIQESIRKSYVNKLHGRNANAHNTACFSFDLSNGGCGWLDGIQIADSLIQEGKIESGMVVTGDSEPFARLSENYIYEPAAAAIILSGSETGKGFSLFRTYSFPRYAEELISKSQFRKINGRSGKRNILSVRQKESYLEVCVKCASDSLNIFMEEAGISFKDTKLFIVSQSPGGLPAALGKLFGDDRKVVALNQTGNRELHTSGPAFALKAAWDDMRFNESEKIIFLTAGSGVNVSIALYNN